MRLITFQTWN